MSSQPNAPLPPGQAINLRDLGELSPSLKKGQLYRCSQIYDPEVLRRLKIKTVVDLRGRAEAKRNARHLAKETPTAATAAPNPANSSMPPSASMASMNSDTSEADDPADAGKPTGAEAASVVSPEVLSQEALERLALSGKDSGSGDLAAVTGGIKNRAEMTAMSADKASGNINQAVGASAADEVSRLTFDVIPAKEFGRALLKMPLVVWKQSVLNLVTLQDPRKPFVKAFADEQLLGFTKYYILILEHSKKNLAAILRIFAKSGNLPALVHCAHGKDRTGVVIMLLMLACGVPHESIVSDYSQSERELQHYREGLGLDSASAATAAMARTLIPLDDAIIASTEQTMRNVLDYLERQYVTPDNYFSSLGLSSQEVDGIRKALMTPEALAAFQSFNAPAPAGASVAGGGASSL